MELHASILHIQILLCNNIELQGLVAPVPKPLPSPEDPGAVKALKNFKDKVQSGIQKYRGGPRDPRPQRQPHTNDFSRLARRICGKSIGVVLGGGGARGISHLVCAALCTSFRSEERRVGKEC